MRPRPPNAGMRIGKLLDAERAVVASWPDRQLRVALRAFVDACARQHDYLFEAMVDRLSWVDEQLEVPGQLRTGSDFELRCLACVERMRPVLEPFVRRDGDAEGDIRRDEVAAAMAVAGETVQRTVLGELTDDPSFDVVCWNEANAVAESVQRPYLAANKIVLEGGHDPLDRFDLVAPMTELTIRYEDEPTARESTAAEIARVLDGFRARAPWPVAV